MSRTTTIRHKGKVVSVLGRTVDMISFPLREKNTEVLHEHLSEERHELIKFLLRDISAMIAHHPTKEEVDEWVHDVHALIEYAVDEAEEIGTSRVLVNMMEDEDIDIEFR